MKQQTQEFLEMISQNTKLCPWFKIINSDDLLKELHQEITEFENNTVKKNAEEELGDILWDFFMLIEKLDIEKKIDKQNIIEGIINKIKKRKPYLFSNKKVTLENAKKIWIKAKQEEKHS
jgi:XTP/dITP diphosphohydrolase